MNRIIGFLLFCSLSQVAGAQHVLSLDSCRAMALRNNKQMSVSRVKQQMAANIRKSARTKYLPHVNALGGYMYSSRSISLLDDGMKSMLSNLGGAVTMGVESKAGQVMSSMPSLSVTAVSALLGMTPAQMQQQIHNGATELGAVVGQVGNKVLDAFDTDTHNVFAGSVMLTQPIFMGGAIIAMNKLANINEDMAANSAEAKRQATLYNIDQTYWQVVSLRHKQKLAQGYLELVQKLDKDVQKMINEGVATRSEGLSVAVKVNEAEMALIRVNDGLVLSKMLLCQLCGLPMDEQVTLADEERDDLDATALMPVVDAAQAVENRPELKILQNMVDISRQTTNILRAGNLPQVALMGGYTVTNPSLYNGFQKKFMGAWNVGVLIRIPVWNWGDVAYKVRAAKGAQAIAALERDDAREKINLQVRQSRFRVDEAAKKLEMARTSCDRANENLRTADLGFREGVISSTTVMEAQTAWLQAQSQKIDAEIDVKLSQVNLQKALGVLSE